MPPRRWETARVQALAERVLSLVNETQASQVQSNTRDIDQLDAVVADLETDVAAIGTAVQLKGTWNAGAGSFPGSGSAKAGWSYIVSGSGTVDGVAFTANDRIIAIVDSASTSTYAGNWHKADYTDLVTSVDGQTGMVDLSAVYHPLMANESAISDPAGGATVDTEARAAIASILAALRSLDLIDT